MQDLRDTYTARIIQLSNIDSEMVKLRAALAEYMRVTGKSLDEALPKQSGKLAWALYHRLRAIKPVTGSIRAKGKELLDAGRGVKVRQSIRDRADLRFTKFDDLAKLLSTAGIQLTTRQTNNALKWGAKSRLRDRKVMFTNKVTNGKSNRGLTWWQLAVALELSARESASGFLSLTPPRRSDRLKPGSSITTKSRYKTLMAEAAFKTEGDNKRVVFSWGNLPGVTSGKAAAGLTKSGKAQSAMVLAIGDVTKDIQDFITQKLSKDFKGVKL